MADEIRITTTVAAVLSAFLENPTVEHYGFEMMRELGMTSGTLYPILARLEKAGWIASSVEDIDPKVEGRRARRNYTMTPQGEFAATQALNRLASRLRLPAWLPRPAEGSSLARLIGYRSNPALGGAQ